MRIFIDTNVFISAIVFGGRTRELLVDLIRSEHQLYTSTYVDAEFKAKLAIKWPGKAAEATRLYYALDIQHVVSENNVEANIRDPKDAPVLNDALACHADILLTGDKDFLESGIKHPVIFSLGAMRDYLYGPLS